MSLHNNDKNTREWLIKFLKGGEAFMKFEEAVLDFPSKHVNTKAPNVPYTFWHILEHIRITQWDILNFCKNPNYKYIKWPDDYWPPQDKKVNRTIWTKTIRDIKIDLEEMIKLVNNPKNKLFEPFPWGEGQHLFREAVLVAEHNAYHIGEFAILRQVVKAWPKK